MTKHIINKSQEEQQEFLESVYDDLVECYNRGINVACIYIAGTLDLRVVDDDGHKRKEEKVSIEVRLTNINDLLDNTRLALGSMLGSLLDENNLRIFDYELLELA